MTEIDTAELRRRQALMDRGLLAGPLPQQARAIVVKAECANKYHEPTTYQVAAADGRPVRAFCVCGAYAWTPERIDGKS